MLKKKKFAWGYEEFTHDEKGLPICDWPELYQFDLPISIPFLLPHTEWGPGVYHIHQNQRITTIEIILSGRLVVTVDGYDRVMLNPGEMIIKPCGRMNRIETPPECGCVKIVLGISGPVGLNLLSFFGFENVTAYPLRDPVRFQQEVLDLSRLYSDRSPERRNEVIGRSMTLLLDLRDQVFGCRGVPSTELSYVLNLMEANLKRNLSMDEFASHVKITPARLKFLFRQYLNTTPHRYFRELRLRKAEQLLSSCDIPVKEIAMQCAYSSVVRFVHVFKEKYHISPGRYRAGKRIGPKKKGKMS